jgi:hypothetical protein
LARDLVSRFYAPALGKSERAGFREALDLDGVAAEIALLRLLLRKAVQERPDDLLGVFKAVELLTKILGAYARFSESPGKQLAPIAAHTVRDLDLLPPGDADE